MVFVPYLSPPLVKLLIEGPLMSHRQPVSKYANGDNLGQIKGPRPGPIDVYDGPHLSAIERAPRVVVAENQNPTAPAWAEPSETA